MRERQTELLASTMSTDIAAAAVHSITSQTELITTLSLAVIGGLLAVITKVRAHNVSGGAQRIELRCLCLMCFAMIFAAISISLGYVVSGMLVEMSPQIFSVRFDAAKKFSSQDFGVAPISILMYASILQFLVFLFSIVFGFLFVIFNRS